MAHDQGSAEASPPADELHRLHPPDLWRPEPGNSRMRADRAANGCSHAGVSLRRPDGLRDTGPNPKHTEGASLAVVSQEALPEWIGPRRIVSFPPWRKRACIGMTHPWAASWRLFPRQARRPLEDPFPGRLVQSPGESPDFPAPPS